MAEIKDTSSELIEKGKVYLILSNLRESGVITQEQAYILSEEVSKLIPHKCESKSSFVEVKNNGS